MRQTIDRRTTLKLLGLGAMGVTGVAACAPDSGSGSTGGDTAATNFQFLAWSLSEEVSKPVLTGLVDGYEDDHDVTIKTGSYPYEEFLNQLILKTRGNEFAGAAQLDIAWLGALAAMGRLVDLGDLVGQYDYTDAALASGQVDGTQYGLPWVTGSIGLVGNTEVLDRAGISEPPTTIEDFESALRAIKDTDPDLIPYAAMTSVDSLKDIMVWMQQFGSPLVEDGQVTIGDEPSVDAVQWFKGLYDDKLIATDVDRFAARTLFAQGKTPLYEDAIVAKGVVTAESPDKDLGSKLVPIARPVLQSGDTPAAALWGHLVIVVEGEGSDSASDFASWLTGDTDIAVDYFEQLGLPPTTQAALSDATVEEDQFTIDWTERITSTATASPFWQYPQYAEMEAVVAEQVQAVLVNDADPADALADAADEIQSLIDG